VSPGDENEVRLSPITTGRKRLFPNLARAGAWPGLCYETGVKVTVQKQNKVGLDKFTATIVPCRIPQLVFTFNQGLLLFGLLLALMAVIRQLIAD
jgi:hypothetical protein